MPQFILFSIILIEGFVSIATEILTIRQLMPVVGNSVLVTSYIIGIFLLALAYGYKHGGKYTKDFSRILRRNFVIACFLLGIGLSYNFVTLFFTTITSGSLLLYLAFVTTPLVYLLGQTVPITMNLFNKEQRVSLIGSQVLHLSTIGSFLGAILTTVLFMNIIGVTWTLIINCMLLAIAALIISEKDWLKVAAPLALILPFVFLINFHTGRIEVLHTNAYNTYQVVDKFYNDDNTIGKMLVVNHSGSSFLDDKTLAGSKYIEMIKKIIFQDLQMKNKNILVLGAGGFSLSAAKTNDNNFIYVDIDPDMEKIAKKHFIKQINGKFIVSDARKFLLDSKEQYPVIVADTYSNRTSIPSHLITYEYFKLIEDRLTNDGVAIINVIMSPKMQDQYSRSVDATIRSAFATCMSIPKTYANDNINVLYVCNKNTDVTDFVYTDDHNRSALDKLASN